MKNLKDLVYNIKDYYIPVYGPNADQPEGLKLDSSQKHLRRSPRTSTIAPPNRPVNEYLLVSKEREQALREISPPRVSTEIETLSINNPKVRTQYPKPNIRIKLTPYP